MYGFLLLPDGGYFLLPDGGRLIISEDVTPTPTSTGNARGAGPASKGRPRHHNLPTREDVYRDQEAARIAADDEDVMEIIRQAMKHLP